MADPDRIPLDDDNDDADESELEFPSIAPQTFTDPYSNVRISIEMDADDHPRLILTQGDTHEEAFHRYRIDLDERFLFKLADELITPLRQYREQEAASQARQRDREWAAKMDAVKACAFRAASQGLSRNREYEARVHLHNCHRAMNVIQQSGTRGTMSRGAWRDDMELMGGVKLEALLKHAYEALQWCISPPGVEVAKRRAEARTTRTRDTSLDYRPVRFCGACKPLGEHTGWINKAVAQLANMTELDDNAPANLRNLWASIEAQLWETEQRHLDRLRGKEDSDSD